MSHEPQRRVKNWGKFQHFKERRPPWIKLYRDILDDMDWHELDAPSAKALVMLWLIASEDEGNIPDTKTVAFRLRMSEVQARKTLANLDNWLIHDDITAISERYRDDTPETETETEVEAEVEAESCAFDRFWNAYPKKVGKGAARTSFDRAKRKTTPQSIIDAVNAQRHWDKWQEDGGKYIPHPATWLNQGRWDDVEKVETEAMPWDREVDE